jgi:glycosyltransferase involved in cell wall biosynthesis
MSDRPEISVVLPCFNEVDNLEPLIAELQSVLGRVGRPFEVVYVDDCSTDGTTERLRDLCGRLPFLRLVRHRANFGESAGTLTGFEAARGDTIITMDADMQNDPADIPMLLEALKGADCVAGVRGTRNDSFSKRMSSRIANFVRRLMLNDGIHDAGCTFRAYRRDCLRQLMGFRALHRFLPTILKIHGFTVVEATINHRPRTRGVSKYGIGNRLWVGIQDMNAMRWYRRRFFPPDRVAK